MSLQEVCPQRFAAPLAPPQAAAAEGLDVDETQLVSGVDVWIGEPEGLRSRGAPRFDAPRFDVLVMEGAGGLFSPISTSLLNVDLALRLGDRLPQMRVVLVARNRLGVIHECVATVRAAHDAGLKIDRIVLNTLPSDAVSCDESITTNAQHIQRWTGCPVADTFL